jgi:putative sterol carrier protein
LAGLGTIVIALQGETLCEMTIHWDARGAGELRERVPPQTPRIIAAETTWREFIEGRFSTVQGVLEGRITIEGPLDRIYPYSEGFDTIAGFARKEGLTQG